MLHLCKNPLDYNSQVDCDTFNCGGFAMQTLDWYMPRVWDINSHMGMSKVAAEQVYDLCFEEIVNRAKELGDEVTEVAANDLRKVPLGVEIVGFRFETYEMHICEDPMVEIGDFHFIWRDVDGIWWEKPGVNEVRMFRGNPVGDWKCSFSYNFGNKFFVRVA